MTTETAAVPAGYMQNAKGDLVPESKVKPIDKLRDQLVHSMAKSAKDLSAVMAAWNRCAFADIAAFAETSAEEYGVTLRGMRGKGNLTLTSYDGRYKVVRQMQEHIRFDERLQVAKELIDQCITEWAASSRDEIKVLINDAFRVDQEGLVSASRVLGLRRLDIKDEKWLRAMEAISDSMQVAGSSSYVRVYERVGDSDRYQPIPLDMAAL